MSEYSVLGGLLRNDRTLIERVLFGTSLKADDFEDEKYAKVYSRIVQHYHESLPCTPKVIASEGFFSASELEGMEKYTDATAEEIVEFARAIVRESDRTNSLNKIDKVRVQLARKGSNPYTVQEDLIRELNQGRRGLSMQDTNVSAILDRATTGDHHVFLTRTRMQKLDEALNGGLRSRRLIAIGGRQKGRKTTLAREILLSVLFDSKWIPRPKVNVAFMAFENDQEDTIWDFTASVAAARMYALNKLDADADFLSGEIMSEGFRQGKTSDKAPYHTWPKVTRDSIDFAIQTMRGANLWVYDVNDHNGGLKDLASLRRNAFAHHFNHVEPDQHLIIVVDYAQLIRNGGTLYDDMRDLSSLLLELCNKLNCTVIALTQFNEAYNKETATGQQTDFIGTKGGGDLEAACHTYITLSYSAKIPDELGINVRRQRRGGSGSYTMFIHPPSGMSRIVGGTDAQ